jgi:hypothetical protein
LYERALRSSRPHRLVASAVVAGALVVPAGLTTADASPAPGQAASATAPVAGVRHDDKANALAKRKPSFPGHRPGRIYLGMSCGEQCDRKIPQLGQGFGVHRWFKKWGNWRGIAKAIQEDRRHHRRPWISIEGPDRGAPTGWRDVGRGRYDLDIRELARTLKANDREPVFISFDHEPSNKAGSDAGRWWARGFNRFHDVLARAHALRHVALAPIMAGWMFSKYNHGDRPRDWLRPGVLNRADFLAVDIYQNDKGLPFGQHLPRIARWLGRHGHPHMRLGVGECGSTNGYSAMTAASWLNRSLRWAAHHPGRVAVISYFNSTAYARAGSYWPLDESAAKMAVFRKWLKTRPFIHRVR